MIDSGFGFHRLCLFLFVLAEIRLPELEDVRCPVRNYYICNLPFKMRCLPMAD